MMKQTIMYLVQQLVSQPDQVRVEQVDHEGAPVLKIDVDKQDIGKVIGKDGQTIKALRAMLMSLKKGDDTSLTDIIIDS